MSSACYLCLILTKLESGRHVQAQIFDTEFHDNPSIGSGVFLHGQTDSLSEANHQIDNVTDFPVIQK
jgi:hypothetical protein